MIHLFEVQGSQLQPVQQKKLSAEGLLEEWIAENPRLIGLEVLVLGRQIPTEFGGRIDILALDRDGDLVIVELKRDRTPRDIVAQVLDYASWVRGLTTKQVYEIAHKKLGKPLDSLFGETFGDGVEPPENLNSSHQMVIVASEFDASSKRIVQYLAEEHGVSINTVFFNVFDYKGKTLLSTDWLLDQEEATRVTERKTKAPWTGIWYMNVDEGPHRFWEDLRTYGFMGACGGRIYSDPLKHLKVGDPLYAYQKGKGYVGYGEVTAEVVPANEFQVAGAPLVKQPLQAPEFPHHPDDPDRAEYVVGVKWLKTFAVEQAKTFPGAFANQNVVCKLRDTKTLEFLEQAFTENGQ